MTPTPKTLKYLGDVGNAVSFVVGAYLLELVIKRPMDAGCESDATGTNPTISYVNTLSPRSAAMSSLRAPSLSS